MRNVLTRFLDNPIEWKGKPATDEQKAALIDRIKQLVNDELSKLAKERLWRSVLTDWQAAYGLRGYGSTDRRRHRVRDIFRGGVPIPESVSDRIAQKWIEAIETIVNEAIKQAERENGGPATRLG